MNEPFPLFFHEFKIEKPPQWTHGCWYVLLNFIDFECFPIWHMFWWLKGVKSYARFELEYNGNGLGPFWRWKILAKVGWFFKKEIIKLGLT